MPTYSYAPSTLYLSLTLTLFILIPLIRHDFWIFSVFEYPRLQKMTLSAIPLAANHIFLPTDLHQKTAMALLIGNLIYLIYLISPFTILCNKQTFYRPLFSMVAGELKESSACRWSAGKH